MTSNYISVHFIRRFVLVMIMIFLASCKFDKSTSSVKVKVDVHDDEQETNYEDCLFTLDNKIFSDNKSNTDQSCLEAPNQFVCNVEIAVWKFTNEFRVCMGLTELQFHPKASYVARLWSDELLRRGGFGGVPHEWFQNGKLGSLYEQKFGESVSLSAENVAYVDKSDDVDSMVISMLNAWIKSPPHRGPMLGSHTHLGVGAAIKGKHVYGTQSFVIER